MAPLHILCKTLLICGIPLPNLLHINRAMYYACSFNMQPPNRGHPTLSLNFGAIGALAILQVHYVHVHACSPTLLADYNGSRHFQLMIAEVLMYAAHV